MIWLATPLLLNNFRARCVHVNLWERFRRPENDRRRYCLCPSFSHDEHLTGGCHVRLPEVAGGGGAFGLLNAIHLIHEHYGFSFWDAMIIEAAIKGGAAILMSEDLQDGPIISGAAIQNPFNSTNRRFLHSGSINRTFNIQQRTPNVESFNRIRSDFP